MAVGAVITAALKWTFLVIIVAGLIGAVVFFVMRWVVPDALTPLYDMIKSILGTGDGEKGGAYDEYEPVEPVAGGSEGDGAYNANPVAGEGYGEGYGEGSGDGNGGYGGDGSYGYEHDPSDRGGYANDDAFAPGAVGGRPSEGPRPTIGWNAHRKQECEMNGGTWDGATCFFGPDNAHNTPRKPVYTSTTRDYMPGNPNFVSGHSDSPLLPAKPIDPIDPVNGLITEALFDSFKGDFPARWGPPPEVLSADIVNLPGGFGKGSATLAAWVALRLAQDEAGVDWRDEEGAAASGTGTTRDNNTDDPVTDDPVTGEDGLTPTTDCDTVWTKVPKGDANPESKTCGELLFAKLEEADTARSVEDAKRLVASRFSACHGLLHGRCTTESLDSTTDSKDIAAGQLVSRPSHTAKGPYRLRNDNWWYGRLASLFRHNVDCGGDGALTQFRLATDGSTKKKHNNNRNDATIRYDYTCARFRDSNAPPARLTNPPYRYTTEARPWQEGQLMGISALQVDCRTRAINQFRLRSEWKADGQDGQDKVKYEYTCDMKELSSACDNDATDWSPADEYGDGKNGSLLAQSRVSRIKWLDRHDVKCHDPNKLLTQFQLEVQRVTGGKDGRDGERGYRQVRYKYKCCAPIGPSQAS